jgi:hypothetical protein
VNLTLTFRKKLLFATLVVSLTNASADDVAASKLARGKDELVLAGIEVHKTSIDTVLRKLGKPTQKRQDPPAAVEGERFYVWRKPNVTVEVATGFAEKPIFKGGLREIPSSVTVDGTDGILGRTGRGRLGAPYSTVARIYGTQYVTKCRQITLEWKTGTTLEVRWNQKGLIDHIEVIGPE